MNPSQANQLQRLVNERLNVFRIKFPTGANIEDFAVFVRKSIEKINSILNLKKSEASIPDPKRIVRYYQSRGWISIPTRKLGREVFYEEIHLVQMLLSYCLRGSKTLGVKATIDEIEEVAEMSLNMCLERFIRGLNSVPEAILIDGPKRELLARCERFHILLVTSCGDSETSGAARAIENMARSRDESYFKVDVCDKEIDVECAGSPEEAVSKASDIIDGDGSIRSHLPEFREEHGLANEALVQVITNRPHLFNWFADWGPTNPRDGVLHLGNYEVQFGVSSAAICASYSLLLALCAELEQRGISPYHLFHRFHPRGCLFDACEKKVDIVLKLLAGDICKDCLEKLRPYFSDELLREITLFQDSIRDEVRVLGQFITEARG